MGMGFNGGAFGVIDSALVGEAVQVECDPILADPEHPVEFEKPGAVEIETKPGRSGGRR